MKKVFIILAAAVALASCDDQMKEARQFAEEFSTAVTSGDSTTLNRIYPDASKADSLALNYVADSLQLEPNATGDTLQIRFSPDVSVTAVKDGEGKYSVIGSHGLFAYPPERLEYAKKIEESTEWCTEDCLEKRGGFCRGRRWHDGTDVINRYCRKHFRNDNSRKCISCYYNNNGLGCKLPR